MRTFLISILLLISAQLFAKEYTITLFVKGFANQTVFVTKVSGDMSVLIDTLESDFTGTIKTTFTEKNEIGFYKFIFPQIKNAEVAFIFNNENVALETEMGNPGNTIKVILSKENELYYAFLKGNDMVQSQTQVLEYVNENYQGADYVKQTQIEYSRLLKDYNSSTNQLLEQSKNLFVHSIIASSRPVMSPILLNTMQKNLFLQNHFFDNIDFSDTLLFSTEIINSSCIQYLTIFSSQYQTKNKDAIFIQAVDTILNKAKPYPATFDFVVNYLLDGFESMGAQNIVLYISQAYLKQNSCENSNDKTTLQRKVLSSTQLAVGKKLPSFEFQTKSNGLFTTKNCDQGATVIVFWATWCSHCAETVPQIVSDYAIKNNPKFKLVTIALDTNIVEWDSFIAQNPGFSKTINACDINGWDGKLAETFNIYATPTIFIIKDGAIIGRPIELEEYKKSLKTLELE